MNTVAQALVEHEPEVTRLPSKPMAASGAMTPMEMLGNAVASGASIETLEKLMALQERWEASQARKAFDAAMAAAKSEIPTIIKNRVVDFTGKTGIRTHYRHEDLAEIARTVDPILAKHGLSYRYRTASPVGEPVTVTCIVSHRDGHSEENTLVGPRDDSGNKNALQSIGSTVSFLQRYTLKASLGLAAAYDDDGAASNSTEDDGPISEEQRNEIEMRLSETGSNRQGFCNYFKISDVPDLPAREYDRAIKSLEKKRSRS